MYYFTNPYSKYQYNGYRAAYLANLKEKEEKAKEEKAKKSTTKKSNIKKDGSYPGAELLRKNGLNPENYRRIDSSHYEKKGLGSDVFFYPDGTMHRTM